jgi:uncharacterized protein YcbX
MAHIEQLAIYPLVGARAENLDHATIMPSGFSNDRDYVVYDPRTMRRISAKPNGAPMLMHIRPEIDDQFAYLNVHDSTGMQVVDGFDLSPFGGSNALRQTIEIEEFEQSTPWIDIGDEPADFMSAYLSRGVRMAKRDSFWHEGGIIEPKHRKVSPLHIVSRASCDAVAQMLGINEDVADRFRPNIVIENVPAFSEENWKTLTVRGIQLVVHRPTLRCGMTGLDPRTGENLKDVPKIFPKLSKLYDDRGRINTIFGVYAYPVLRMGERSSISTGDEVVVS